MVTARTRTKVLETEFADMHAKMHEGQRVICPLCSRVNQIYGRQITTIMAQQLQRLAARPGKFIYTNELQAGFTGGNRMYPMLRYWGLVIEQKGNRGWWQITTHGIQFLRGRISVPKIVWIYNNQVDSYSAERVTFKECLNSRGNQRPSRLRPLGVRHG